MPDFWSKEYISSKVNVDLKNEDKGNSFREFRDKLLTLGWSPERRETELLYSLYVLINKDEEAMQAFMTTKVADKDAKADLIAKQITTVPKDFTAPGIQAANYDVMTSIDRLREEAEKDRQEEARRQELIKNAKLEIYSDRFSLDGFFDPNQLTAQTAFECTQLMNPKAPEPAEQMKAVFVIWCLSVKRMSVKDVTELFTRTPEQKKALGQEFLNDLLLHPVRNNGHLKNTPHGYTIEENAKWLGTMFARAVDKLKDAGIQFPDKNALSTSESLKAVGESEFMIAAFLGKHMEAITQITRSGITDTPFIEGYGGNAKFDQDRNMLLAADSVAGSLLETGNNNKKAYEIAIAQKVALPVFGGMTLQKAASEDRGFLGFMANAETQEVRNGGLTGYASLDDKEAEQLANGTADEELRKKADGLFAGEEVAREWKGDEARKKLIWRYAARDIAEESRRLDLEYRNELSRQGKEYEAKPKKPLNLQAMSQEELLAAAARFDKAFADLKEHETGLLQRAGKKDISSNFLYGEYSVTAYVNEVVKDKIHTEEQRILYEKALVMHSIENWDPDRRPNYAPFEIRIDDGKARVTSEADLDAHSYAGATKHYRDARNRRLQEEHQNEDIGAKALRLGKFNLLVSYECAKMLGAKATEDERKAAEDAGEEYQEPNPGTERLVWAEGYDVVEAYDRLRDNYERHHHGHRANISETAYVEFLYTEWTDEELQQAKDQAKALYDAYLGGVEYRKNHAILLATEQRRQDRLPKISQEQIQDLREKVKRLRDVSGVDLDEFINSGNHRRYSSELGEDRYLIDMTPFDIVVAAMGEPKEQEQLREIPNMYYDEAVKALDYLERTAEAAKKDPNRYNYADMDTKNLAFWFNSHNLDSVLKNVVLGINDVKKESRGDGTQYTVFEFAQDLPTAKFDPDKIEDFDPAILKRAQDLYNEHKDMFDNAFARMHDLTHETYGAVLGAALEGLRRLEGTPDMAALNEFRNLVFEIRKQDPSVCKIGTDKEPVYVEPLLPNPKNGEFELAKASFRKEEADILDVCYKELKAGADSVSWNSGEYNDLMRSVISLRDALKQPQKSDPEARKEYVDGLRDILERANLYFLHKANDGYKNDGTNEKIIAVERMCKMLRGRYEALTGAPYSDRISLLAGGFDDEEEMEAAPRDPSLRGGAYVLDEGHRKIDQIKVRARELQASRRASVASVKDVPKVEQGQPKAGRPSI